jgi:putative DNA primase/helicase
MTDPRDEFLAALAAAGLAPTKPLRLVDGELERYRVEGDKPGSTNGWAVFYSHPLPAGAFGSWKTGATHTWRSRSVAAETPKARAERQRQLERARVLRADELQRVQASARQRAVRLWRVARPANDDHRYVQAKRIRPYGLKQLRNMLVVPARDAHGVLHTLQFIAADGTKRFLSGGRVEGCYCAIGKPAGELYLCEGIATACTVYELSGQATAACFSCGNLLSVARALRAKFPELRLVVVADNDAGTAGNPGVTHATRAAAAVGGLLVVPEFNEVDDDGEE